MRGLIVAVALALTGCATAYKAAVAVEGAGSRALNQAAVSWVEYDGSRQLALVAAATNQADAVQKLSEWRKGIQEPVQKSLHTAMSALQELDNALNAVDAVKSKDWVKLTADVLSAYRTLSTTMSSLGVPIPLPTLPGGAS